MVMLYWLLVILGVLDNDFDGDGGDHHGFGGAGVGQDSFGKKRSLVSLVLGTIPVSITGSFMAIFMWLLSLWGNFYLNGTPGNRSLLVAFGLLFPISIISLLLARIFTWPLTRLFSAMQKSSTEVEQVAGREARVVSAQVDEKYGQVEILTQSAPLLVNARLKPGSPPVSRGDTVVVLTESEGGSYFLVESQPRDPEEPQAPQL